MSESNGKYPAPFINDGYTEAAFVAGVDHVHPPLRFEFRPALLTEQNRYNREVAKLKDAELERYVAKWMAGRLVAWDQPQPIIPENVARLKPRLLYRLLGVLLGNEAPDTDPYAPVEIIVASQAERAAAAAAGKSLADYLQERDAKN